MLASQSHWSYYSYCSTPEGVEAGPSSREGRLAATDSNQWRRTRKLNRVNRSKLEQWLDTGVVCYKTDVSPGRLVELEAVAQQVSTRLRTPLSGRFVVCRDLQGAIAVLS